MENKTPLENQTRANINNTTTANNVNNQDKSNDSVKGELTFEDKVVQTIVGIALESVDGLLTIDGGFFSNVADKLVNREDVTSGIEVEVGKKQVAVDLDIVAEYGTNMSKLYEQIKHIIVEQVERMTSLQVIEVNVNVVDVKTKEQHEKDSVTVQDRVSNAAENTSEFASKQTSKAKKALNQESKQIKEQTEPRVE